MDSKSPFKWRHFAPDIILWGVRWYCLYPISYRQLEEMMCERGVEVDHCTLYRWMQKYAPEIDKRCRPHLQLTNDSWRVDETYIKVKGKDRYLYRAVDSDGNTLDFLLSAKRDAQAAQRFFRKALKAAHTQSPRVITVDKNAADPKAIDELKKKEELSEQVELRQNKYLNNIVEQDHRGIKRLVKPGMGFGSFNTARRTMKGYEIMNMLRKGQVVGVEKGDVLARTVFVSQIFGMAA
ncbi:MAG: IS6 family transposase [Gloeocapsa sp. UFS-A4-WI-NPMV-4B04]|jgi:transposase-like protein|nr:IS6 family transposase [Gloeocapsa sp. UFS-A4-WI-NPMV-4B04]